MNAASGHADAVFHATRRIHAKGAEQPVVAEHRVESGELFHRHLTAAKHEREAVMRFLLEVAHAGTLQELIQGRLLQLHRRPHRRDIAAADQRLLGADRTGKAAVEVLGRERSERRWRVAQNRLRMQHALIEREPIHERLER